MRLLAGVREGGPGMNTRPSSFASPVSGLSFVRGEVFVGISATAAGARFAEPLGAVGPQASGGPAILSDQCVRMDDVVAVASNDNSAVSKIR